MEREWYNYGGEFSADLIELKNLINDTNFISSLMMEMRSGTVQFLVNIVQQAIEDAELELEHRRGEEKMEEFKVDNK